MRWRRVCENFAGCAVVISHDRWFLDRIATHILSFEGDSKVVFYEGSYSEYEEWKKAQGGDTTAPPREIPQTDRRVVRTKIDKHE